MRFLEIIFRLAIGLSFAATALPKFADPVGAGMLADGYLGMFGLGFLSPAATFLATFIAVIQFTTGICLLMRMRMKVASITSLVINVLFATASTYLIIKAGIPEYSYFSGSLTYSGWTVIGKNVLLVLMSVFLVWRSKKRPALAPTPFEWSATLLLAAFASAIAIEAWLYLPRMDYSEYRIGADIRKKVADNYPDYEGKARSSLAVASVWDAGALDEDYWNELAKVRAASEENGRDFALLCPDENVPESFSGCRLPAEERMLKSLVRSNGGLVLLDDGLVSYKCSRRSLGGEWLADTLQADADVTIAKASIRQTLFVYISITGLTVLLLLLRHFCKVFFNGKSARIEEEEE